MAFMRKRLHEFMDERFRECSNPVDTSHITWVQQFGDALPGFSDDLHLASRSRSCICAELYGIGYCRSSFSDEQFLALENHRSVLNSIAHSLKDEFGQFGYLLQLRATDAVGAELGIIVVRILVTSFNPEYQLMVRYVVGLGEDVFIPHTAVDSRGRDVYACFHTKDLCKRDGTALC